MSARFTRTITATPADIDELGHVNNAVWVRWLQEVATAHWSAVASPEHVAAYVWVLTRHEIDYLGNVQAGETVTARGQLLATVEVTLGIDAAIDGTAHRAGEKVQLRAGRHELTAGTQHQFITVKIPCVVRDKPSLDCY